MQWYSRDSFLANREGEKAVIEKYLWFPVCLQDSTGRYLWKWLTKAKINMSVHKVDIGGSMEWGNFAYYWCYDSWV